MPLSDERLVSQCFAQTQRAADLVDEIEIAVTAKPPVPTAQMEPKIRELADTLRDAHALAVALQRRAVGIEQPQVG